MPLAPSPQPTESITVEEGPSIPTSQTRDTSPPTWLFGRDRCTEPEQTVWGSWCVPNPTDFKVRGPNYLNDRVKVSLEGFVCSLAHVDLCQEDKASEHVAALPDSFANRVAQHYGELGTRSDSASSSLEAVEGELQQRSTGLDNQTLKHGLTGNLLLFVFNFMVPGTPNYNLVLNFALDVDQPQADTPPGFARLLRAFENGTDEYRNTRFKLIPRVHEGSWLVKSAVGSTPAILGRKLPLRHFRGQAGAVRYIEIDIDVGATAVAGQILRLVKGYAKTLVIDLVFLIEAQADEELPEVLLGGVRLCNVDMDACRKRK